MSHLSNNFEVLRSAVRTRRKALGLSQQDVAELCGVRRQTIGRFESGDPSVKIGTAMMVADVLGLRVVNDQGPT